MKSVCSVEAKRKSRTHHHPKTEVDFQHGPKHKNGPRRDGGARVGVERIGEIGHRYLENLAPHPPYPGVFEGRMAPPSFGRCWRLRFLHYGVPHGGRAYLAEPLAPPGVESRRVRQEPTAQQKITLGHLKVPQDDLLEIKMRQCHFLKNDDYQKDWLMSK